MLDSSFLSSYFITCFCLVTSRLTAVGDELCKVSSHPWLEGLFFEICWCWISYCSFLSDVLLRSEWKFEQDVVRSQVKLWLFYAVFYFFFLLETKITQPVRPQTFGDINNILKQNCKKYNVFWRFYLFIFVQMTEGFKHVMLNETSEYLLIWYRIFLNC